MAAQDQGLVRLVPLLLEASLGAALHQRKWGSGYPLPQNTYFPVSLR
jgi:hypothetical protein